MHLEQTGCQTVPVAGSHEGQELAVMEVKKKPEQPAGIDPRRLGIQIIRMICIDMGTIHRDECRIHFLQIQHSN